MNVTEPLLENVYKLGNYTCNVDQLPQICKDMIPTVQDIQLKYNIIIIIGILNLIVMSFFIYKIKKLLDSRKVK